jgi:hypothetical protein
MHCILNHGTAALSDHCLEKITMFINMGEQFVTETKYSLINTSFAGKRFPLAGLQRSSQFIESH